jgi:hypothetical protein
MMGVLTEQLFTSQAGLDHHGISFKVIIHFVNKSAFKILKFRHTAEMNDM